MALSLVVVGLKIVQLAQKQEVVLSLRNVPVPTSRALLRFRARLKPEIAVTQIVLP